MLLVKASVEFERQITLNIGFLAFKLLASNNNLF